MPNPNIQALKQDEFTTASVFNLPPPAIQTTFPSIEDDFTKLPEITKVHSPENALNQVVINVRLLEWVVLAFVVCRYN